MGDAGLTDALGWGLAEENDGTQHRIEPLLGPWSQQLPPPPSRVYALALCHMGALMSLSLVLGTLTALCELAFFASLRLIGASSVQTSLYLFLSLTQLIVILSIRNKDHFWQAARPSGPLLRAIAVTAVLTLALPYLPVVAPVFSLRALPLAEIGMIVLVVFVYLVVLDCIKVWYYRVADRMGGAPWWPPSATRGTPAKEVNDMVCDTHHHPAGQEDHP